MNSVYREQVRLLLHVLPLIYREKDFAIHGGTAINLFVKNMPRYSVDVDLTYIPVAERGTSLQNINDKLFRIGEEIKKALPHIKVKPVPAKLLCMLGTISVKIEVNVIQRGLIGETMELSLCERAKAEFELFCKARTVSVSHSMVGKSAQPLIDSIHAICSILNT